MSPGNNCATPSPVLIYSFGITYVSVDFVPSFMLIPGLSPALLPASTFMLKASAETEAIGNPPTEAFTE